MSALSAAAPAAPSNGAAGAGGGSAADARWLRTAYERNAKRTHWMFSHEPDAFLTSHQLNGTKDTSAQPHPPRSTLASRSRLTRAALALSAALPSISVRVAYEVNSAYGTVKHLPPPVPVKSAALTTASASDSGARRAVGGAVTVEDESEQDATTIISHAIDSMSKPAAPPSASSSSSSALTVYHSTAAAGPAPSNSSLIPFDLSARSQALSRAYGALYVAPIWHPPWRLLRVIAGHQGWVRSIAVDPGNDFFVSASNDRTLKVWDLASGELRLTLTGHVSSIRAVAVSARHPYMFSASEDKTVKCLTGDHMVLTRTGWRSIKSIARLDEVASFNVANSAMEWKAVTHTQRFAAGQQPLFRMQGSGMDVVATKDHRMLLAYLSGDAKLRKHQPYDYEDVGDLLPPHVQYLKSPSSTHSRFEHCLLRAVVRSGLNLQPAVKIVIPGLEQVCDWWWQQDQQLGFLRFVGFWLGHGHLVIGVGCVGVSQRNLEGIAWLDALLDAVFPRWWYRYRTNIDDNGTTCNYAIRCPPLYDWLRAKSAGPLGYNPLNRAAVRSYPHFTVDPLLAAAEEQTRYRQPGAATLRRWTEVEMLEAMTSDEPCCWCDTADCEEGDEMLLCNGAGCRHNGHLRCRGLTAVPEGDWLCPDCSDEQMQGDDEGAPPDDDEEEEEEDEPEVVVDEVDEEMAQEAAAEVAGLRATKVKVASTKVRVTWNNGEWDIINGHWFYRKRWLGADVADTFSRLSREQAVALLEGFCCADGTFGTVQFDEAGDPVGLWRCGNSSFPLIDHLQLIGQLAGARVDLTIHTKAGTPSLGMPGRPVTAKVDHWLLAFNFSSSFGAQVPLTKLAKPVDVSADIDGRGYYDYEDDGKVYDLTVEDNHNFLTQRLSAHRVQSKKGELGVRAHPVFVGNCWDLEQNAVIRNYHGHLSGVYCLALHPQLDVIFSGGRDSTCRMWDMRTKQEIAVLSGHSSTVASLLSQAPHPQLITGSHDTTIKLWDVRSSRCVSTLTHHKKSVRALLPHPTQFTFASASADNIKVWKCADGVFLRNMSGHAAIVNALAINRDDVLVSGGDDGSLCWWDWRSGYVFDRQSTIAQSGSLDSERGIFDAQFDVTGSRLLTAEADKTIKVWAEDESATEQSHPIRFQPPKHKRF